MTKISFKKLLVSCISICTIGIGIYFACAGGEEWEGANSSFTPESFVEKKYSPFFYSYNFYYFIGHDTEQTSRFNNTNVQDWKKYLGNLTTEQELNYVLNNTITTTWNNIFSNYVKNENLSSELPQLNENKANEKVKAFFTYLNLAKQCEIFTLNEKKYAWDDKPIVEIKKDYSALNNNLLKQLENTKDSFLKQRYWFQLIRSYFYNGGNIETLFNKYENDFPKNTIYYRSLCNVAGKFYKEKNYAKANYLYSLVFENCDELKTTAHFSFHPQNESDWQQTLSLCKNNAEKETLWQMLGIFYEDELRAMKEIYNLNNKSEKIGLLLTRKINKIENKINYSQYSTEANQRTMTIEKNEIDENFIALITKISNENTISKSYLWNESLAYLHILLQNYTQASSFLNKAKANLPNDELNQNQFRLLSLINKVAQLQTIKDSDEQNLLKDLEWIYTCKQTIKPNSYYDSNENKTEPNEVNKFRYQYASDWVQDKLSQLYLQQNEKIKAICFAKNNSYCGYNQNASHNDFYKNDTDVAKLVAFLNNTNASPFEKIAQKFYPYKVDDVYEYQAIKSTLDNNLTLALSYLQKSSLQNAPIKGNPFNNYIKDCHDCDHVSYKGNPYTKLILVEKMKLMYDKILANEEVYNNALLLGNAFYNITHYGNARYFYEGSIIGSAHSQPNYLDKTFFEMLTKMNLAIEYYNLALKNATTDEQRVKCYYLLSKCERNNWYTNTIFSSKDYNSYSYSSNVDFLKWENFNKMANYKNTKYYQEVLNECGYFRRSMMK